MNWLPIKTAPTDGTKVIIAYRYGTSRKLHVAEGWFFRYKWRRNGDPNVRAVYWIPMPDDP